MPQTNKIQFAAHSVDTTDLICPRCEGFNLHHIGVTLYERAEDESKITVIDTLGPRVSIDSKGGRGNPSSRRHGMVVKFDCEQCSTGEADDYIELAIAQHKGSTEMSWRFSDRKPRE